MNLYHYTFPRKVSIAEVEATLLLALLATEALHGEAEVRLDGGHAFDAKKRTCIIDAGTAVGRDFVRLFTQFVRREFGDNAFAVKRVGAKRVSPAAAS
jgi:hypothetical protein